MDRETFILGQLVADWLARLEIELANKRLFAIRLKRLEQSAYTCGELDYCRHAVAVIKWAQSRIPNGWRKSSAAVSLSPNERRAALSRKARPRQSDVPSLAECLDMAIADELKELIRIVMSDNAANHRSLSDEPEGFNRPYGEGNL